MTQYAFYFDSSNCVGCKACQVACKENHHLPVANLYRRVYDYAGGTWDKTDAGFYTANGVFHYFVSMACNHCESPACVANCPTGAMQKDPDTGIVWTDHEVCIGCGTCVNSCPYRAPQLHADEGYSVKCDMCRDEVAAGNVPFCVAGCPMRALDWGPRDELVAKYGEGDMEIEPLPANTTNPTTILNPHKDAQKTGQGTGAVVSFDYEL